MSKITTIIIGLLSGIIGAAIQISIANKKIYEKNVIKERKEWRDKIRSLTSDLNGYNPNYKRIKAEFQTRLNPHDQEDKKIIRSLNDLIKDKDNLALDEFNEKVSYLLKHDWDRVKLESNRFSFFPNGSILMILFSISIFIQKKIDINIIFPSINNVKYIQDFTVKNLIYYTFTTLFIMGWIVILYRCLIILFGKVFEYSKGKIYLIKDSIYQMLKIPSRKFYNEIRIIDERFINTESISKDEYLEVIKKLENKYKNMENNNIEKTLQFYKYKIMLLQNENAEGNVSITIAVIIMLITVAITIMVPFGSDIKLGILIFFSLITIPVIMFETKCRMEKRIEKIVYYNLNIEEMQKRLENNNN